MVSKQRFMNVEEGARKAFQAVEEGSTRIHPDRFSKTYFQRLENIKPWCISRQLRWGHRIPIWYDETGKKYVFDEETVLERYVRKTSKKKYSILSMIIFNLISDSRLSNPFSLEELLRVLFEPSLTTSDGVAYQAYTHMYKEKFKGLKGKTQEVELLESICKASAGKKTDHVIQGAEKLVDMLSNTMNINKK